MAAKLLAQQGTLLFLADVGDGKGGDGQQLVRVFDRSTQTLGEPFGLQSILARGYWEDVTVDDDKRGWIEEEIATARS